MADNVTLWIMSSGVSPLASDASAQGEPVALQSPSVFTDGFSLLPGDRSWAVGPAPPDGDGGHSGRHSFYGSTGGICSVYDATEKEIFLERYKGNINERESGGSDSLLTSYKLQK